MKKMYGKKDFLKQLPIIMILCCLVVVSFLVNVKNTAEEKISSYAKNAAELTTRSADSFSIFFSSKIDLTKNLSETLSYIAIDRWETVLSQAESINENTVFVIDSQGNDVFGDHANINVNQDSLINCFDNQDSGIIGPGYDPSTGVRATFAYTVFSKDNAAYMVLACIRNDSLYDKVDLTLYGDEGFSYIVDENGYTVLFSHQPNSNKTFSSAFELLSEREADFIHPTSKLTDLEDALKNGKSGVGYYIHDGADCVVAVSPININGNWSVISVLDENYLYDELKTSMMHTLLLMFITIICFGTMILMLTLSNLSNKKYQLLNAQLEEARKDAEDANKAKSDLFARMSHDMRTPMNGILGLAELSENETDPAVLKNDMGRIQESGKYLLELINDTLDYQKMDAGRMKLEMENVSIDKLMDDGTSILSEMAAKKGVSLEVLHKGDLYKGYVKADKLRIRQIITNLLSNAIKFTSAGGIVELCFVLHEKDKHVDMQISVTDTGTGMSEEFVKNEIFSPFSQEHNEVTGEYAGSGLGLSIVKQLVDLMGAKITVDSQLGVGTKFIVDIELDKVSNEDAHKEIKEDQDKNTLVMDQLAGVNVLLAEDHPLNAEITRRLLEKADCRVTWTKDGKECVDTFTASPLHTYDIILMDIRMPNMNGLEAAEAIRSMNREDAHSIPIIAMTANAYEEDIHRSLEAGMNAHLAKPINQIGLYEAIAEQLRKR